METDTRKVSLAYMPAFNIVELCGQTNARFLFTLKNKRNVGWCWKRCLMQIKLSSTSCKIVQHGDQTSATCWMMLHQHVGSVWRGLDIKRELIRLKWVGNTTRQLSPQKESPRLAGDCLVRGGGEGGGKGVFVTPWYGFFLCSVNNDLIKKTVPWI